MAFVPASNVLQVEIRGEYFGQEIENTLYFQCSSAINGTNVAAIFDFIEDEFLPDWLTGMASTVAIDELYGTDLTSASSPTYTRTFSPALNGTESGAAGQPGSIATCISFRTQNRGRSARGRNYVAGVTENNVSGNNLDLGWINGLVAAYELLLGGGSFPVAWQWVVLSRFLLGAPRIAGLVQEIVDVLSTDVTADSQRGRLRGA